MSSGIKFLRLATQFSIVGIASAYLAYYLLGTFTALNGIAMIFVVAGLALVTAGAVVWSAPVALASIGLVCGLLTGNLCYSVICETWSLSPNEMVKGLVELGAGAAFGIGFPMLGEWCGFVASNVSLTRAVTRAAPLVHTCHCLSGASSWPRRFWADSLPSPPSIISSGVAVASPSRATTRSCTFRTAPR